MKTYILKFIGLIICSVNLNGQNNLFNKWLIQQDQIQYMSVNYLTNETIMYDIKRIDTIIYSINDFEFYKTKNYLATFPGGEDSLKLFIRNNLEYQPYNKVYPKIIIAFIVNVNGDIMYVGILRGAELSYNQAAINLINKMPKWFPAKINGEKISTFNTLTIDFTIK